jgi:hypothetical protein
MNEKGSDQRHLLKRIKKFLVKSLEYKKISENFSFYKPFEEEFVSLKELRLLLNKAKRDDMDEDSL